MKTEEIEITKKFKIIGATYDDKDNPNFLSVLQTWINYKEALKKINGRNPNIPESLTEGVVAKHFQQTYRKIEVLKNGDKSLTKFDCYKKDTIGATSTQKYSNTTYCLTTFILPNILYLLS